MTKIKAIVYTMKYWHKTNGYTSTLSTFVDVSTGQRITIQDLQANELCKMFGGWEGIEHSDWDVDHKSFRASAANAVTGPYMDIRGKLGALFGYKPCAACEANGSTYKGEHKPCDVCNRSGWLKIRKGKSA